MPKKPKRRIEYVRLDRIEFANRNPKLHDTDGVAGSINRFGMAAVPTRDERTGRLVAGHGRIEALQLMRSQGQAAPAGVKTDKDGMWLVPVMAGWSSRSDAEAEAYLIGDNEWTARGSWDIRELAALLQEMQMFSPDLMQHTGITLERLEDMVAALDAPEDSLGEGDSASKNDDGWPVLSYQVPREVFDSFNTVMQLCVKGDAPEHQRLQRVADLTAAAVERDL